MRQTKTPLHEVAPAKKPLTVAESFVKLQSMIDADEEMTRMLERMLAMHDFDLSESSRIHLTEARRQLRWAAASIKTACDLYVPGFSEKV